MQENTTIRKRTELRHRSLSLSPVLLAIAALTGCTEQQAPGTSTVATDDSAAAYAALSASLDLCDSKYDACVAAAGGTAAAEAMCKPEADSCMASTQTKEEHAKATLEREAHHCRKTCSDNDAGASDDADAGSGDMHGCLSRHAPKVPKCLAGLFTCLDSAGIREGEATRNEVRSCLHEAHSCIKDEIAARRAERHARHKHPGAGSAGADAQSTAGTGSVVITVGTAGGAAPATGGSGGSASQSPGHGHLRPFWKR